MNRTVKQILLLSVACICCGAVVLGGIWCSTQSDSSPCTEVCIVIEDSLERQFVDVYELENYLKRHLVYPLGQTIEQIDCHAVELCLQGHDMVRKAECYPSPFGCVHIRVMQRVPVLSVISDNGCYYVDSDRRIMPVREQIDVDVPVFKGAVNQRAAIEEYFEFAEWLKNNRYWGERICSISIETPKYLILSQKGESAKIILGELNGYSEKLNKLQQLYTKGFEKIGYPDVREYDLRFAGQVVSRK